MPIPGTVPPKSTTTPKHEIPAGAVQTSIAPPQAVGVSGGAANPWASPGIERAKRVQVLSDRNRYPFVLCAHPAAWLPVVIDGKPLMLPELVRVVAQPGANGWGTKDRDEDMTDRFRRWIRALEDSGRLVLSPDSPIPAEFLPPGVEPGGYLRKIAVVNIARTNGEFDRYEDAWTRLLPGAPGRDAYMKFQRDPFDRWRLWLVESGLIPPPLESVLIEQQQQASIRIARVRAMAHPDPEYKRRRLEAEESRNASVAEALAEALARA